MTIQRVVKPTTQRGKRILINRQPKLIENKKQTLFLHGRKTSSIVSQCMKDLYHLKKPDAVALSRKNDIIPFEDCTKIEAFSKKCDTSLFMFASNSKKRPNNIIMGRTYDHQLLDMVELGIKEYKGLAEFSKEKITTALKPCILFCGQEFEEDSNLKRIQNLLTDLFQREKVNKVRLQGLEHVLMFTAISDQILMRSYKINLKKSGCHIPRIELTEIGPSVDFEVRRTKLASEDLYKLACKQPKELKAKKVKNVTRDTFGTKLGRVHIKQQSIKTLQTRKMKGLRKTPNEKRENRQRKKQKKATN